MDTTPEYKKQCKAVFKYIGFIFNEGPPNLFIVDRDDAILISGAKTEKELIEYHHDMFTIHGQLYRQDQLQGVIKTDWVFNDVYQFWLLFNTRYGFWVDRKYWGNFKSWEQLWLAFVMHEKFGKTWNSDKEKWVKEG